MKRVLERIADKYKAKSRCNAGRKLREEWEAAVYSDEACGK